MGETLQRAWFLDGFQCVGDRCEDTCCKGWGMQLTRQTVDMYRERAPELLDAVDSGEADYIMKRDPKTDYCVKFDKGWCGVHASKGEAFLGDACHFYPRSTRCVGEHLVMTASLSCPEIARSVLFGDYVGEHFSNQEADRLPFSLKSYEEDGLSSDDMLAMHRAYLDHVMSPQVAVDDVLPQLRSVASSLALLSRESWPAAVGFYLRQAAGRVPSPEVSPTDSFNILNMLRSLVQLSKATNRPRLEETIEDMLSAMQCHFDAQAMTLITTQRSASAFAQMQARWQQDAGALQPMLRRWIYAQLSMHFYPFSGLGADAVERTTIIAVRYATLRLALMSFCAKHQRVPDSDESVRIVQSLSRFIDHLADATTLLVLCEQAGWMKESRLAGVLLAA